MSRWSMFIRYIFIFSILFLCTGTLLFAQENIVHSPPRNFIPGQEIELEAVVEGVDENVQSVRLLYKLANQSGFTETKMDFRYGYYHGIIPPEYATESGVKYAIIAELSSGRLISYPGEDPYDNPVFVRASGSRRTTTPSEEQGDVARERVYSDDYSIENENLILSPTPNAAVPKEEVLVAISLFTVPDVDPNSVVLLVDGVNVTKTADITRELVTYRTSQLPRGSHNVEMRFKDVAGRAFEPLKWGFRVISSEEAKRAKINMNGRMYVETSHNEIKDQIENINKFNTDLRGSYGFLNFTGNVYLNSKENPGSQPVNRYSFNANSQNIRLQLGDSYPRMSRLGIWGKRIRGLDAQVLLKYFNLHFVYGYSARAIQGQTSTDTVGSIIDSTNAADPDTFPDVQTSLNGYNYGRRILGIRPSFGSGKNFQLGFTFVSSRDDTSSVDKNPGVNWSGIKPKDNVVIGSDLLLAFDRQRFVWESSASLSWTNENILGGALTKDDSIKFGETGIPVADFPIDPSDIEGIFIINANVKPFLPIPFGFDSTFALQIEPFNFADYQTLAYQSKVSLNYFNNFVSFRYRKIGSLYEAFMNPYTRKDIAGYDFSDRIRLFDNKVYLSLKYEQLEEGLSRSEANRISSNNVGTGLSLYPGGDFPVINFNFNQSQRKNLVDSLSISVRDTNAAGQAEYDTTDTRIENKTLSNMLSISQTLYFLGLKHDASINYLRSSRSDLYERAAGYPSVSYNTELLSFSFQTNYEIPLLTRLSASINTTESSGQTNQYQNISLGGRYQMFDRNLVLNATGRFSRSVGATQFTRIGFDSSVRYRFLEVHEVRTLFKLAQTKEPLDAYTDLFFQLRYSYQF